MTVTPNITLLTYCARSGSTLIAQSLNEHLEETIVVPELRLIQLLAWRSENAVSSMTQRQLRRLLKRDFQMSNLGLSHETLEDIASISVGEGRLQLLSNILEAYKVEHSLTGNHYVIKNGRSIHEAWELRRMLPELRVLNVVRDPRGVINSMLSTSTVYSYGGAMAGGNAVTAAELWRQHTLHSRKMSSLFGEDFQTVKYEDFVSGAPGELIKIATWINCRLATPSISPPEHKRLVVSGKELGLHKLVTQAPKIARIDAWKVSLERDTGVLIENRLEELMSSWGYNPHFTTDLSKARVEKICDKQRRLCRRRKLKHLVLSLIFNLGRVFIDRDRILFLIEQRLRARRVA